MLSPNAGKDEYLLEINTGTIHYLKNETDKCRILAAGSANCRIADSYQNAEQMALIYYGCVPSPCPYCNQK